MRGVCYNELIRVVDRLHISSHIKYSLPCLPAACLLNWFDMVCNRCSWTTWWEHQRRPRWSRPARTTREFHLHTCSVLSSIMASPVRWGIKWCYASSVRLSVPLSDSVQFADGGKRASPLQTHSIGGSTASKCYQRWHITSPRDTF